MVDAIVTTSAKWRIPVAMVVFVLVAPSADVCAQLGHVWSKAYTSSHQVHLTGAAMDTRGNVFLVGAYFEDVVLDGGILLSDGGMDSVITKLNSDGEPVWTRIIGGATSDFIQHAAVDSLGDLLVSGGVNLSDQNPNLEPLTNLLFPNVEILKFNTDGDLIWFKRFSGLRGSLNINGMHVDSSDNVLLTGRFTRTGIFTGAGSHDSVGRSDIYVVKIDPNGVPLWSRTFGGSDDDLGVGITTDESGNVYVGGNFESNSLDLGDGAHASVGAIDLFLAKFDPDGVLVWSGSFGNLSDEAAEGWATLRSLDVDPFGALVVTGNFARVGRLDFGGDPLRVANGSEQGQSDVYLVKFDSDGNHIWSQSFGRGGTDLGNRVVADPLGNVVLASRFLGGRIEFGGEVLVNNSSQGQGDIFLAYFDPDGNHLSSLSFGGNSGELAESLVADDNNEIIITGAFGDFMDVGGGAIGSADGRSAVVGKFSTVPVMAVEPAPAVGGGGGGNCFIATAAYGTPMAEEVNTLRAVRDTYLLSTAAGTAFVDSYYRISPPIVGVVSDSPALRAGVRTLLAPIVIVSRLLLAAPAGCAFVGCVSAWLAA